MSGPASKHKYYTLPIRKIYDLLTDAKQNMKLFGENIKTDVEKYSLEEWDLSPINEYMDAYLNAKVLRDFIIKKIEYPDEEITRFFPSNGIDGIFMTTNDLGRLHNLAGNFETSKAYLSKTYGISLTMLN